MSKYPPPPGSGNNPPPYYSHWTPHPPPNHHPPHHPPHYSTPDPNHPHPYPYYVQGTVMIPVPKGMPPPPPPATEPQPQPTYITNIYQGESSTGPPVGEPVQVGEYSGDFDWIPTTATTAHHLTGRAVLGGYEGLDRSPLWVIRAWHGLDLVPGKLSVKHNKASVMFGGKDIPVQNIEVLCARPENLRWVPASNGDVPPGAVAGGQTNAGETLYVGRARSRASASFTPGNVHPSQKCCYVAENRGIIVSHRVYDVLTRKDDCDEGVLIEKIRLLTMEKDKLIQRSKKFMDRNIWQKC